MVVSGTRVPETGDLWQLTMEHSPVGMAIVSPGGDFITANVALCDMLGYDPDVMATLTFQDITHPDDLAADVRLVAQAVAGDISSYRITKRYLCSDGSVVTGDLSVALLRDAHGAPIHFISQIVDLTERQAFVERLDAAEAAAEAERRTAHAIFEGVKDEFVATVSHELRTPLTSALAHLELLEESADLSVEGHVQVKAARRNMLRLSHLVADLLFSTRVSSGSPLVAPYRVDLVTVVDEALAAASLDAEGAGVRLTCRRPESMPAEVDGMRLRQVVDNLLANAIAHSPRDGEVAVELAADHGDVVLAVADRGVGIDPDEVGEVFGRFYRGRNALRRHVPGAGLGLAIVQAIVEAHGGEVALESAPGAGTTVRVRLPR